MAKYVPVKDLDELLSARAAGVLFYAGTPEVSDKEDLVDWWKLSAEEELLPNAWAVLVEDGDDE